jgi:hypothetical protein
MVPDSLRNRNVLVFPEKWFSVESEPLCEIVYPFVETFQIQWKWEGSELESLETPILPFHGCSTKTQNVSNWFTSETFRFLTVWNRSKWFKPESETFLLAKQGLIVLLEFRLLISVHILYWYLQCLFWVLILLELLKIANASVELCLNTCHWWINAGWSNGSAASQCQIW